MKRPARIALTAAGILAAVGAAAIGVAARRFDPNAYKPDIVAAVKRATGRDLALNGDIGLKFSLTPTIEASDATFSNPPGFSRPQMATLQAVEIQFALLPLLSGALQIDRLLLVRPDILLETDAAGRPNWRMAPQAPPAAAPGQPAPAPAGPGRRKMDVSLDTVRIQNGTLAYRDGPTGKVTALDVARIDASAQSADSPVHMEADATYNGARFALVADTGALSRLEDSAATAPWPGRQARRRGHAHPAGSRQGLRPGGQRHGPRPPGADPVPAGPHAAAAAARRNLQRERNGQGRRGSRYFGVEASCRRVGPR
jgi:AsmA protein